MHTRIFRGETGDEKGVGAIRVEFGVDGTLGEHGHLVGGQVVGDGLGFVLQGEFGDEAALDDDVDFRGARVRVRGVEAAGAQEAQRHGDAGAHQGGKHLAVGFHRVSALAHRRGIFGWVVEVVHEVPRVLDQVDPVHGRRGQDQLRDQVCVARFGVHGSARGAIVVLLRLRGRGGVRREGGKESGRDEAVDVHFEFEREDSVGCLVGMNKERWKGQ